MREPKFSDAPCYGKEFDAASKICRICLGNKSCQIKSVEAIAARRQAVLASPSMKPPSSRMSNPRLGISHVLAKPSA